MPVWRSVDTMSNKKPSFPTAAGLHPDGPPFSELAVRFGLNHQQLQQFQEAFTHSSYAHETGVSSNERLEFLGDSVLAMITASFLYEIFPAFPEGKLSKLKAIIVSAPIWAELAVELKLPEYLRLGAGETKAHGRQKQNIAADLFEAFIGAYYLAFGLEKAAALMRPLLTKLVPKILPQLQELDAKTNLQEVLQAQGSRPVYQTTMVEGPPHQRIYTVEVAVNGTLLGEGQGSSLKEAQRLAAVAALQRLGKGTSF
jgi:ribonuclease-3